MVNWTFVDAGLPDKPGEYLCFVSLPRRNHNGRIRQRHNRYMALVFDEGGFWIHGGMPTGLVVAWAELQPPPGFEASPAR